MEDRQFTDALDSSTATKYHPNSTDTIRFALKTATDPQHQALHYHPLLKDLLTGEVEPLALVPVWLAFYRFHAAYELADGFDARHVALTGMKPAKRCDWLAEDMAKASCPIPSHTDITRQQLTSDAAMLGYLYVTEGSLLGGTVIQRQLLLGFAKQGWEDGSRFYRAHGELNGKQWQQYLSVLEVQSWTAKTKNQCCEAATDAFAHITQELDLAAVSH